MRLKGLAAHTTTMDTVLLQLASSGSVELSFCGRSVNVEREVFNQSSVLENVLPCADGDLRSIEAPAGFVGEWLGHVTGSKTDPNDSKSVIECLKVAQVRPVAGCALAVPQATSKLLTLATDSNSPGSAR